MKKQKTILDPENDIFWVIFEEGVEDYYEEYAPGFIVEFDKNSKPIGIEIRNWSRLFQTSSTSETRKESYDSFNFIEEEDSTPNYSYAFS